MASPAASSQEVSLNYLALVRGRQTSACTSSMQPQTNKHVHTHSKPTHPADITRDAQLQPVDHVMG